MKTYEQMAHDALRRIEEYETGRRESRKAFARAAVPALSFCIVALLGIGLWKSGVLDRKNVEVIQPDGQQPSSEITQPVPDPEPEPPSTKPGPQSVNGGIEQFSTVQPYPYNVVKKTEITADIAVNYEDYRKLVGDSEMIILGTISGIDATMNPEGLVCSILSFGEKEILKGNDVEDISVFIPGGRISAKEYYRFHENFLREVGSDEAFEEMFSDLNDWDMVESSFMGSTVYEQGDRVLLFLTYDDDIQYYRITGSPYWGIYEMSDDGLSFARIIRGETVTVISRDELLEAVGSITDNSGYLREQRANHVAAEKDWTVEARDPDFDKYKGNDTDLSSEGEGGAAVHVPNQPVGEEPQAYTPAYKLFKKEEAPKIVTEKGALYAPISGRYIPRRLKASFLSFWR